MGDHASCAVAVDEAAYEGVAFKTDRHVLSWKNEIYSGDFAVQTVRFSTHVRIHQLASALRFVFSSVVLNRPRTRHVVRGKRASIEKKSRLLGTSSTYVCRPQARATTGLYQAYLVNMSPGINTKADCELNSVHWMIGIVRGTSHRKRNVFQMFFRGE